MTFSPQQIESMLQVLASRKRPAANPLPAQALGVEPGYFTALVGADNSGLPTQTPSSQAGVLSTGVPPVIPSPPAVAPQRRLESGKAREGDEGASRPASPPPSDLDSFSEFSGKSPRRKPTLPPGAKNIQCHTIIRDEDSGRVAEVYTYDLPEEGQAPTGASNDSQV